jgi:hypothetical protein
MSPKEYADRYLDLQVPVVQDDKVTRWQSIRLDQYVLVVKINPTVWDDNHSGNQAAFDNLLTKLWDHFGRANEKKTTLMVHFKGVNDAREHVEFTTWQDLWYYARKALVGKGSPEEAAITLQLADKFDLLKGGDLQTYCDTYLGLDCNGFVGNYLVHGLRGGAWDAEPPGTDYLANKQIDAIANAGAPVATVDDLVPASMYMVALVGDNGRVVPGGGMPAGHIFITNIGIGSDTEYVAGPNKKATIAWAMMASESTAGVGLITSPCQFVSEHHGIFSVKRQSHSELPPYNFRAFRVQ